MSPPSTNMRLEVTLHRRGPGFWQVSSVNQSLHTGAHVDSPLHVFKGGLTTAEITLDQVMGEALVVDLSFVGGQPRHHRRRSEARGRGGRQARRHRAPAHGLYGPALRHTARGCPTSPPRTSPCIGSSWAPGWSSWKG